MSVVDIVRDQVYSSPVGRDLLADLYVPREARAPRPAILWLHGGGWRFGDRRLAPDLKRHYAERGYVMASIDYRLSREARFPAALEDVKTAVRWLKSVSGRHGIDPRRIALWGSSAGGHLAALAVTSGAGMFEGAEHPQYASDVAAVVDCYGPSDFLQMDMHRDPEGKPSDDAESIQLPPGKCSADADSLESMFLGAPIGTVPELVRQANPIHYVKPGLPPFLLLHGASDTAVPSHQSELLYEALAASGNEVSWGLIRGLGHGFTNRKNLDDIERHVEWRGGQGGHTTQARVFECIGNWFDRHLQGID